MLAEVTGQTWRIVCTLNPTLRTRLFLLLSLGTLILSLQITSNGQAITKQVNRKDLFGGIEVGTKSIKAIVIQRSEPDGRIKIVFNEVINKSFATIRDGKFTPETIGVISQTVENLYRRMLQQYQVLPEQTYIIGCSDLSVSNTDELKINISYRTGKNVNLLDMQTEASFNIAGTIPRRHQDRATWFDNRGMSVLIDVGTWDTKGGYQQIRMAPMGKPDYMFYTFGIPQGTINFSNEVEEKAGKGADIRKFAYQAQLLSKESVQEALKTEVGKRPGLLNRKKVYLSGGIVWAMVALLFPEDRQALVPIKVSDINDFYNRAVNDMQALLYPKLTQIRISRTRTEAVKELEAVRNTFSPENLVAGAEMLRTVAKAFNLNAKNREIVFARFSNLSLLLSYLRLQADNGPQP
jgi:hypothetical protein